MAEEVSKVTKFTDVQEAYVLSQPTISEWTNNTSFYVLYPKYYYSFANRWLRRWLGWYDGFVQGVHDGSGGLLSTRIGTTLVRRIASQIYGGGLIFEQEDECVNGKDALDKVNYWVRMTNFGTKIKNAIEFATAGGTCAIKTNVSKSKGINEKNDLWIDIFRADRMYLDFDFKGKVVRGRFLVNKYTNTVPSKKECHFYIVEDRYYEKNKLGEMRPYAEYKIFQVTGDVANLDVPLQSGRSLGITELPKDVQRAITEEYGILDLNKKQLLPFTDLGVDVMKYSEFISNLPDLQFGESLLAPIQTYLFMYDYMYSCFNTDLYLGRGRVLVPKWMQKPKGGKPAEQNWNNGLDSFMYTQYETINGEQQKPIPVQFDLRAQDWVTTRNNLLEAMSTAIGMSPSTIASYLNDNTIRTAREVSSSESSTTLLVETKRALIIEPINSVIDRMLHYYSFPVDVTAKFSKSGQTNTSLQIEDIINKLNAGLISLESALKELNSDMSSDQIKQELVRIKQDKQEKQDQQQSELFGDMKFNDEDGDFVNEKVDRNSEETKPELASTNTGRNTNKDKVNNS